MFDTPSFFPKPSRFIAKNMSEINKPYNGLPVVFQETGSVTLPAFIVPNKDQVEIILRDAGIYEVITAANVDEAEAFVKAAKALNKEVNTARMAYTRPLDDLKEAVMATEKEVTLAIKPIEAAIVKEKQRQYDEAQAEKKRLQKIEDDRVQAEIKEAQRKAGLDNMLVDLRNELIEHLFNKKTLAELEEFVAKMKRFKVKEQFYQERTEEANDLIQRVLIEKEETAKLAIMDAEEAEIARKQREKEAKDRQDEANRKASQELLSVATSADLRSQVATQSVVAPKGIVVKKVGQIVDVNLIPREYLIPDQQLINKAIADGVTIPGVLAIEEVKRSGK
jgi:hypothetical protein